MATTFFSSPWPARIAALLFTAFIALFAFEAGDTQQTAQPLDLMMHLLPVGCCLLIIGLAWSREWIGALLFLALCLVYGWWSRDHWQWVLAIGTPMLGIAILYAYAWRMRRRTVKAA